MDVPPTPPITTSPRLTASPSPCTAVSTPASERLKGIQRKKAEAKARLEALRANMGASALRRKSTLLSAASVGSMGSVSPRAGAAVSPRAPVVPSPSGRSTRSATVGSDGDASGGAGAVASPAGAAVASTAGTSATPSSAHAVEDTGAVTALREENQRLAQELGSLRDAVRQQKAAMDDAATQVSPHACVVVVVVVVVVVGAGVGCVVVVVGVVVGVGVSWFPQPCMQLTPHGMSAFVNCQLQTRGAELAVAQQRISTLCGERDGAHERARAAEQAAQQATAAAKAAQQQQEAASASSDASAELSALREQVATLTSRLVAAEDKTSEMQDVVEMLTLEKEELGMEKDTAMHNVEELQLKLEEATLELELAQEGLKLAEDGATAAPVVAGGDAGTPPAGGDATGEDLARANAALQVCGFV